MNFKPIFMYTMDEVPKHIKDIYLGKKLRNIANEFKTLAKIAKNDNELKPISSALVSSSDDFNIVSITILKSRTNKSLTNGKYVVDLDKNEIYPYEERKDI